MKPINSLKHENNVGNENTMTKDKAVEKEVSIETLQIRSLEKQIKQLQKENEELQKKVISKLYQKCPNCNKLVKLQKLKEVKK